MLWRNDSAICRGAISVFAEDAVRPRTSAFGDGCLMSDMRRGTPYSGLISTYALRPLIFAMRKPFVHSSRAQDAEFARTLRVDSSSHGVSRPTAEFSNCKSEYNTTASLPTISGTVQSTRRRPIRVPDHGFGKNLTHTGLATLTPVPRSLP